MIGKLFSLATGSWWGLAATAAAGMAAGVALTVAADAKLFHGPEIKRLNDQHTADAGEIGALRGALILANAGIEIERNLRKGLGEHERVAAETEAGACSAQVAASRKRGIEIGNALCERRHRQ